MVIAYGEYRLISVCLMSTDNARLVEVFVKMLLILAPLTGGSQCMAM